MQLEESIRGHGDFLKSLANLGILCVLVLGAVLTFAHYGASIWQPVAVIWSRIANTDLSLAASMGTAGKVVLSLSMGCLVLPWLMPLLTLRRLGASLHRNEALSLPVAEAFRKLAHSFLLHYALFQALAGFTLGILEAASGVKLYTAQYDFAGFFLWIIACTCLYSMAHLMKLAAEAADDARSIV